MTLREKIEEYAEELREALRHKEHTHFLVSAADETLLAIRSRAKFNHLPPLTRIQANLAIGLYQWSVQPETLRAYATGAIAELTWLASELRKQEESAA